MFLLFCFFFFQAEDGIRDLVRSRGLGDVYKRQVAFGDYGLLALEPAWITSRQIEAARRAITHHIKRCLLYTSDAADDLLCVDLGGRRIIKKKNTRDYPQHQTNNITIHNQ